MSTSFTTTPSYLIDLWITFASIGNLTCIILLICHFCMYYKQEITISNDQKSSITKPKKKRSFFVKIMSILTLLSMIGFTISILIATINHFSCILIFDKLNPVFYQMSKCCIYLQFIMRLRIVYHTGNHAINQTVLKIYGILLIITYLGLSIYGYIAISHDQYIFTDTDNIVICKKSYSMIFLICSLLSDAINSIFLLFAYITPLIKIMAELRNTFAIWTNYNGKDLKYPVIKVSILTSVATISSILTHIISMITTTYIVFLIDIPINVLCVMLMTPYYPNLYEKSCYGLIKCIEICDDGKKDKNANNDQDTDNKKNKNKNTNNKQIKENDPLSKQDVEGTVIESTKIDTTKIEETNYDTRTNGEELHSLKYEPQSEMTKTIKQQRSI